jgi:hypothetical protein
VHPVHKRWALMHCVILKSCPPCLPPSRVDLTWLSGPAAHHSNQNSFSKTPTSPLHSNQHNGTNPLWTAWGHIINAAAAADTLLFAPGS